MMRLATVILLLGASALVVWLELQTHEPPRRAAPIALSDVLGGDSAEVERVTGPVPLDFPADHGRHDAYRNEWWYFTGNLMAEDGRRFGFQYTLFRFRLANPAPTGTAWDSEHLWMAHFAVSDAANERFHSEERFARDALGLAGATSERWWLGSWQVEAQDPGWQLEAMTDAMGLRLDLVPDRSKVLQGEAGYSRKGPAPGQASRYYSYTRLRASGELRIGDWSGQVSGLAWLDREWGSGQLDDSLAGWDWFALQLDDGRDLMVYRLRRNDGTASEFSAGSLVWPDGRHEILEASDFTTEPGRRWRDREGVNWPLSWRIRIPAHDLDLTVDAVFDDQRWRASVPYWEGMVEVQDRDRRRRLGRGYMELSGYADQASSLRGQR
jgi:predicted secreted hydrolase